MDKLVVGCDDNYYKVTNIKLKDRNMGEATKNGLTMKDRNCKGLEGITTQRMMVRKKT